MSIPPAFGTEFFAQYTTAEVRLIVAGGQEDLKQRAAADVADARARIQAIADGVGLSVAELVNHGARASKKVPARYRNPADASKTWTGRGREPKWVTAALAKGVTKESMEISPQAAQQ